MNRNAKYQALLHRLDGLTAESQRRFGDAVQCRAGCGLCCHGLFDIGVLDALLLHEAWAAAAPETRDDIERRAEALLARVAVEAPTWQYPYDLASLSDDDVDAVLERIGLAACPVLSADQACRLYEARPFYCRVHGLKIRDTGGDLHLDTSCELNFATVPKRAEWPGYDVSGHFDAESELLAAHGVNPDARLLIPAVVTRRFAPFAKALAAQTGPQ